MDTPFSPCMIFDGCGEGLSLPVIPSGRWPGMGGVFIWGFPSFLTVDRLLQVLLYRFVSCRAVVILLYKL